jgi:hypothetical protein
MAMHRAYGGRDQGSWQHTRISGLYSRAKELERMLEIGAYDSKIQQREAEVQALRQKKALLESELQRLRRALDELSDYNAN